MWLPAAIPFHVGKSRPMLAEFPAVWEKRRGWIHLYYGASGSFQPLLLARGPWTLNSLSFPNDLASNAPLFLYLALETGQLCHFPLFHSRQKRRPSMPRSARSSRWNRLEPELGVEGLTIWVNLNPFLSSIETTSGGLLP